MKLQRRAWLVAVGGSLLLPGQRASWAEVAPNEWIGTLISLPPRLDRRQPPVVTALALDSQGHRLAIAGDDHWIRMWDLAQRTFSEPMTEHEDWVRALAFSPDGSVLASAGQDRSVVLWDAATRQPLTRFTIDGQAVNSILFRRDGTQMATVGYGDVLRWFDVRSGEQQRSISTPCVDMRALAISQDDGLIAAGGRNGKIRIWDLFTGQVVAEYSPHRRRVRSLSFAPDGQSILSCGEDGLIHAATLTGEALYELHVPEAKLFSLAFCGTDQLATGGSDNLIRIWNLNDREETGRLAGHTGSVAALVSSDDVLASAGFDTTVRVWRRDPNVARDRSQPTRRVGTLPSLRVD